MMSIIALNIIAIAIQFSYANQIPAAVNEMVQENLNTDNLHIQLIQQPNTMHNYLTRLRRQNYDGFTVMDSYLEAYKLSHDDFQDKQEKLDTKIAEENAEILKRPKRSAAPNPDPPNEKDFIKFEITDAIQPDELTLKHRLVNKGRNLRMPYEISDTLVVFGNKTEGVDIQVPVDYSKDEKNEKPKEKPRQKRRKTRKIRNNKPKRELDDDDDDDEEYDDDDVNTGESKKIKVIMRPYGNNQNNELPPAVKKAIDLVIQQEKVRIAKSRSSSKTKSQYGVKINKPKFEKSQYLEENKMPITREVDTKNWRPIPNVSLGRYPVVHTQMENAPDYLTFVPVKSYKAVSYGKPVDQVKPAPPTIVPVTKYVPVPEVRYIIKEVPIPVSTAYDPEKFKPSVKVTYDTSLVDEKFKAKQPIDVTPTSYQHIETQTKPAVIDDSKSYSQLVTPTTATKTFIDHNKPILPNAPKKTEFENIKIEALTSLLDKEPNEQLKAFNELLQDEHQIYDHPEDNRAPILFHPYGVVVPKRVANLNIKVLDDVKDKPAEPKPEPISLEEFNKLYGHEGYIDYPPHKEFTPITEDQGNDGESLKLPSKTPIEEIPVVPAVKEHVIHHHDHSKINNGISKGYDDESESHSESGYAFGYRVRDYYTGNDFGHTQNKNTDGKITGEYHILLPDKRVQVVRYTANDDGFHADVSYLTPDGVKES